MHLGERLCGRTAAQPPFFTRQGNAPQLCFIHNLSRLFSPIFLSRTYHNLLAISGQDGNIGLPQGGTHGESGRKGATLMGTKNENISAQAFLERLSRTAVKPRAEKASGRKPDVNAVLSALGIPVGSQDAPGKVSGKPAPQAGANPEAKLGEKPAAQTEIAALISRQRR